MDIWEFPSESGPTINDCLKINLHHALALVEKARNDEKSVIPTSRSEGRDPLFYADIKGKGFRPSAQPAQGHFILFNAFATVGMTKRVLFQQVLKRDVF